MSGRVAKIESDRRDIRARPRLAIEPKRTGVRDGDAGGGVVRMTCNQKENPMSDSGKPQLLHLVLGGELVDFEHATFKDLEKVETVGIFPNYASAHAVWKAKAQQTVDNAHMRYFIVHLHRLLDPSKDAEPIRTASRR